MSKTAEEAIIVVMNPMINPEFCCLREADHQNHDPERLLGDMSQEQEIPMRRRMTKDTTPRNSLQIMTPKIIQTRHGRETPREIKNIPDLDQLRTKLPRKITIKVITEVETVTIIIQRIILISYFLIR